MESYSLRQTLRRFPIIRGGQSGTLTYFWNQLLTGQHLANSGEAQLKKTPCMYVAMQWSYFGPIENVWEVQIWIFVDVQSIWKWGHWYWVIWDFPPGWDANHNCEYIQTFTLNENVAKSESEKVSWFVHQSQIYILMFITFTFWFDWDSYQLMFSSITIYW